MRRRWRIPLWVVLLVWALPAPAARAQADGTPVHVVTYTVQAGDTTGAIAEYFFGDISEATRVARYNKLRNVNRIAVGQDLLIPFYTWEEWQAYAERTGQEVDIPATHELESGSQDVTVEATDEGGAPGGLRANLLAIIVYGSLVVALSFALYWRSRRHEDRALGMGAGRQ